MDELTRLALAAGELLFGSGPSPDDSSREPSWTTTEPIDISIAKTTTQMRIAQVNLVVGVLVGIAGSALHACLREAGLFRRRSNRRRRQGASSADV